MKKIGIAGVGGIGSNVAMHLARSGLLEFKIADFDIINESNLNRQFYFRDQIGKLKIDALEENLKRINNEIKIEKTETRLDKKNILEIFKDCPIIIEGFDNPKDKSMLLDALSKTGKLIVSANGLAGLNTDDIITKKIGEKIYIIGDFKSDINSKKLFSPMVNIVAAKMANIVLKELGITDNL